MPYIRRYFRHMDRSGRQLLISLIVCLALCLCAKVLQHRIIIEKTILSICDRYIWNQIEEDFKYFPVLTDAGEEQEISFSDSWMEPRSYGGDRKHEGTDIMSVNNRAGYFKIISVSDGVIEKLGWLELGGYRIGIRTENGNYFYYAHLHSYADGLSEGTEIKAGSLLGFMGDTGYSKIEGTTGNFPVHLHFGVYFNEDGKDKSINPYYLLKWKQKER